ncbi:hypothetical protein CPC1998_0299B, partial [Chlamydia psittaci C19/98]
FPPPPPNFFFKIVANAFLNHRTNFHNIFSSIISFD